jgi:hypothetical protein
MNKIMNILLCVFATFNISELGHSVSCNSLLETRYGAICPYCSSSLGPCFSCNSNLKCTSCRICHGCGKTGF